MSETSLVKTANQDHPAEQFSAFGNIVHFENAQRMAKALASSAMVPDTYRGEANLGSCLIALEMANRIGANVLSVMQNLYVIHGKPAWSSQFLIACVNASGRFSPLRYRMTGTAGTDSYGCVAWATDKTGEKLESPEITIGIAKAEGWASKNGSKWKTMPELMLRYRTATLFARLYAPELTMGIHTDDEVIDVVEVAPVVTAPVFVPSVDAKPKKTPKVVDAVMVTEPTPAAKPPQMAKFNTPELNPTTAPTPATAPENAIPVEAVSKPETTDASELGPVGEAAPEADKSFEEMVDTATESPELIAMRAAMVKHEVTEAMIVNFASKRALFKPEVHGKPVEELKLTDLMESKIPTFTKNILAAGQMLKTIKEA